MHSDHITSINPATLESLGDFPVSTPEQVKEAVARARKAQPGWRALGFSGRSRFLCRIKELLLKNLDDVAHIISQENGKPVIEAIGNDILPVLDLITFYTKNAERLLKKERVKLGKWTLLGRRSHLEYVPHGVVGVISPWNYPLSIPLGEVCMALIVGNTVILKPSELTTLTAFKIKEIIAQVELPQAVFELVTGAGEVGQSLVEAGCDKIAFTGSVATGKHIMKACAESLTPVTLELGGKDPFIVFEDAELDTASSAAVWGAFCNSGQVCASVERVYVHKDVAKDFIQRVVQKTQNLRQGEGLDPNTDLGAMTSESQLTKVAEQVEKARSRGAKIHIGGQVAKDKDGYFYQPTVITDVKADFEIMREETFGPVLPVVRFDNEDEAIELANDSQFGLNAYVWTADKRRAHRVASQLDVGTVNINESVFTHALPQTPWGGPKNSGIGLTHGSFGLLDLVRVRHIHENTKPHKKNFFWWYGYSEPKKQLIKALAHVLFAKGFLRVKSVVKFLWLSLRVKVR